jgi:3-hydroxybutyryl-CoA dehydrogenase
VAAPNAFTSRFRGRASGNSWRGPNPANISVRNDLHQGFINILNDTANVANDVPAIGSISVIGAGTMGHGIAQVAAQVGYLVVLCDVDRESLARGVRGIEANLAKGQKLGKLTEDDCDQTLQRIRGTTNLAEAAKADLIVEAAPEKLAIKQEILREIEAAAPGDFIFATNTSSLSITEIAAAAQRPERVVGMHFFNPVHLMRLIEIVVGKQTAPETVDAVLQVARKLRKEPITVKDVPGFASSRLGIAIGLEAMRMFEQGVASAADIDKAMELGYNHPMGPLKLTDVVGLDIRLHIAEYLHEALGAESFRPPEILRTMVAAGKLGKKSGEGFYQWEEKAAGS